MGQQQQQQHGAERSVSAELTIAFKQSHLSIAHTQEAERCPAVIMFLHKHNTCKADAPNQLVRTSLYTSVLLHLSAAEAHHHAIYSHVARPAQMPRPPIASSQVGMGAFEPMAPVCHTCQIAARGPTALATSLEPCEKAFAHAVQTCKQAATHVAWWSAAGPRVGQHACRKQPIPTILQPKEHSHVAQAEHSGVRGQQQGVNYKSSCIASRAW
jgi:hypothetical protein